MKASRFNLVQHRGPCRAQHGYTLSSLLLLMATIALGLLIFIFLRELFDQSRHVFGVFISADGSTVVIDSPRIRAFDVATGNELPLPSDSDPPEFSGVRALSPDGRYVIREEYRTSAPGRAIVVIPLRQAPEIKIEPILKVDTPLALTPDGKSIVARDPNNNDLIWIDFVTRQETHRLTAPVDPRSMLQHLALAPVGDGFAVTAIEYNRQPGGLDREMLICWADRKAVPRETSVPVQNGYFDELCYSPDGRWLATELSPQTGSTSEIHVYSWPDQKLQRNIPIENVYFDSRFLADGRLAIQQADRLDIVRVVSGETHSIPERAYSISAATRAPLFVTFDGHDVVLWNSESLQPIRTLWKSALRTKFLFIGMACPLWMIFLIWLVTKKWRQRKHGKPVKQACLICGKTATCQRERDMLVCAKCRDSVLTAAEANRRNWRSLFWAACIWFPVGIAMAIRSSPWWASTWFGVPLAWLTFAIARALFRYRRRWRRLNNPERYRDKILAELRTAAGVQGELHHQDEIEIWCDDAEPPPPIAHWFDETAQRFHALTGLAPSPDPISLVAYFSTRVSYSNFLRRAGMPGAEHDAACLAPPFVACRELEDQNLSEPGKILCMVFVLYLMVKAKLPLHDWLFLGLANLAAERNETHALASEQRMMQAAVATGRVAGAALIDDRQPRITAQLQHRACAAEQIAANVQTTQALSFIRFLNADEVRRAQLHAWCADAKSLRRPLKSVPHYFGVTAETLFRQWEQWILAQVSAPYPPPPERVVQRLNSRHLPLLENRQAPYLERLRCIFSMGWGGYPYGAESLIRLAGDEADYADLRAAATWALQSISGQPFTQPEEWRNWLDSLPEDVRGPAREIESPPA